MSVHMKVLQALFITLFSFVCVSGCSWCASAAEEPVTAIDIAIRPDDKMIERAQASNAELRKDYPKGFALDASHHPHITLLQRFVKTADLDKSYAAAAAVLAKEKLATWKLSAFNYCLMRDKEIGLEGIVVKPTPELLRLQQELIDAVAPFTSPTGTAAAFVRTPEQPDINETTMYFVTKFLDVNVGKKYNPHVTTGVSSVENLEKIIAKPFDTFTFSPAGVSVYQLGNFGTAQTELKSFEINH